MKFNKNEIREALKSFSINFSVVSFGLGVFEQNIMGAFVGFTSILSAILFCMNKDKGE